PSYMPPEQAAGRTHEIGPLADVYALGAVLYALLTGRPPFQAPTPAETLRLVMDQEPVPPRRINSCVPKALETICLKCLLKEPAKRYASAGALAEDLDRYQAGLPVLARPTGRWERGRRWCRRNPALASLLGVIAFSVVGFITAGLIFTAQLRDQRDHAERERVRALEQEQLANEQRAEAERAREKT